MYSYSKKHTDKPNKTTDSDFLEKCAEKKKMDSMKITFMIRDELLKELYNENKKNLIQKGKKTEIESK